MRPETIDCQQPQRSTGQPMEVQDDAGPSEASDSDKNESVMNAPVMNWSHFA